MLRELSIKNFAIIDDLNIRFDEGLTILSGETGAGKSIIVNAVNLLLGSRASSKMIRDGCDAAELFACFDVPETSKAAQIMAESGHDPSQGFLVRRIIAENDRHRIYINDRMATMQTLANITADLASISGQHAHQGLLKEETHLPILDRYGNLLSIVQKVTESHGKLLPLIKTLDEKKAKKESLEKEMDLLLYQAREIDEVDAGPNEDEALEQERMRLKNAETLKHSVYSAVESLHGADGAVIERLGQVRKDMEKAATMDNALSPQVQELSDHLFGLEDIVHSLRAYLGTLETESDRLVSVEARLDSINRLKRKYGGTLEAIRERRDEIQLRISDIDNLDDDIALLESHVREVYDDLAGRVRSLSHRRKEVAADFAEAVEKELAGLKMAGTRFCVDFSQSSASSRTSPWLRVDGQVLTGTGIDHAVFMIAPNVGESMKALSSIASGGELSRVVLALKAILAETDAVGTIVFDEVDAGIGGAVADLVGKKLDTLSRKHQLICITHLPQIARFGDHHYQIEKKVVGGRTTTTIRPMDQEERIEEIARMLGGEEITQTAMEHARSLVAP